VWPALRGVVTAAATAVDSLCYGRLVVVPWNFFRFNVLSGGGSHYGTHPWHWYLTNGLPTVTFTLLPLALRGAATAATHPAANQLMATCAWFVAVHSLIAHKVCTTLAL